MTIWICCQHVLLTRLCPINQLIPIRGEARNFSPNSDAMDHSVRMEICLDNISVTRTGIVWRIKAALLFNINRFDSRQGRYDLAYDLNESQLGQEDPRTLKSLNLLASVLRSQGKYCNVVPSESSHSFSPAAFLLFPLPSPPPFLVASRSLLYGENLLETCRG
jgi:hypothetical protein